ncbi:MAG TPA: ABC transporter permease, partial [Vicinamibacterales bacterium]
MQYDALYAIRALLRDRRFSIAVVAVLALGIGADLTVYALVSAILIRPLPFPHPDQLVRLWETNPSADIEQSPVSGGTFQDWRRELKSFDDVEAFDPRPRDAIVQIGREPEIARQTGATDGFMRMLGVRPVLGPAHQSRVSDGFWTRRFGRDPSVIGTKMIVEGFTQYPVTIDGVLPNSLDVLATADLWGHLRPGDDRDYRGTYVVGRLKPGVTMAQAQAELDAMSQRLAERHPAENGGWRGIMQPLKDSIVAPARTPLILLYVSVSLLLLIAAGNVAILFAVRRLGRRRIVSIQLALGASRARLLIQALVECAALVGTSTAAGLLVAAWLLRALTTLAPASIPRLVEVQLSADVIGAGAGIGGLLTLLVWAVASANSRLTMDDLRVAGAGTAGATSARLVRSVLVRVEIAACTSLLLVTCSTVRSFIALERTPLGFDPHHVLLVDVRQPIMKAGEHVKHYPTLRFARTADTLTAYAASLPGVEDAAAGVYLPLSGSSTHVPYRVLDREIVGPLPGGSVSVTGPDTRRAALQLVDADFFRVSRTPILTGRAFEPTDRLADTQFDDFDAVRGAGAAIVNAAFAREFGALPSMLTRYLAVEGASYPSVHIVGVAADVVTTP